MLNFAQIGIQNAIATAGGSSFDADYQAVLDRATVLGFSLPSAGQQVKQNQLVLALKAGGIWTLLDILYIMATDGDASFATLNWKTPSSFQITQNNSPTFTTNQGFSNATNASLNTNFTPSTNGVNYLMDNASIFCDNQVNTTDNSNQLCGGGTSLTSNCSRINPRNASNNAAILINCSAGVNFSSATSVGFYHGQRTSSTALNGFKDGASQVAGSVTSTMLPTSALHIMAFGDDGVATAHRTCKVGIFGAGSSLSGKEADLYSAWNTYFTSL